MQNFSGVITVSLEKRYNKTSLKATNNAKTVRLPYNESKSLQTNSAIAARMLATDCGIECQDYYILSQENSTLYITPNALSKTTF